VTVTTHLVTNIPQLLHLRPRLLRHNGDTPGAEVPTGPSLFRLTDKQPRNRGQSTCFQT
jgi:hypothetical protein